MTGRRARIFCLWIVAMKRFVRCGGEATTDVTFKSANCHIFGV